MPMVQRPLRPPLPALNASRHENNLLICARRPFSVASNTLLMRLRYILASQPGQATPPIVVPPWSARAGRRWLGGCRGSRYRPCLPYYTRAVYGSIDEIKRGSTVNQAGHFVNLHLTILRWVWRRKVKGKQSTNVDALAIPGYTSACGGARASMHTIHTWVWLGTSPTVRRSSTHPAEPC